MKNPYNSIQDDNVRSVQVALYLNDVRGLDVSAPTPVAHDKSGMAKVVITAPEDAYCLDHGKVLQALGNNGVLGTLKSHSSQEAALPEDVDKYYWTPGLRVADVTPRAIALTQHVPEIPRLI